MPESPNLKHLKTMTFLYHLNEHRTKNSFPLLNINHV